MSRGQYCVVLQEESRSLWQSLQILDRTVVIFIFVKEGLLNSLPADVRFKDYCTYLKVYKYKSQR